MRKDFGKDFLRIMLFMTKNGVIHEAVACKLVIL